MGIREGAVLTEVYLDVFLTSDGTLKLIWVSVSVEIVSDIYWFLPNSDPNNFCWKSDPAKIADIISDSFIRK